MKAEEYLKDKLEVCKNRKDEFQLHDMYKFEKYAIQIARSEERSKALSSLEEVMRDNEGVQVDFDVLKDKFKDLINK